MTSLALLKIRAREVIRSSNPSAIKVGLVFLMISLVFNLLSTYLVGMKLTEDDIIQIAKHMEAGNLEYALEYAAEYTPGLSAQLINLLLQVAMSIVSVGFVMFILNTIRSTEPCFGNLLDGFGMPIRIILLKLLIGIFVMLWSMLFIIPGIIAAYRYRLAVYLLIDHPEYSPMECIRESKRLMNGHKSELFMLDISFIGWRLLSALPLIGWLVQIWNTPYFSSTYALYYQELAGIAPGQWDHDSYGSYNNGGQNWQ